VSAIELTIVQPSAPDTVIVGAAASAVSLAAAIAAPLPPELAGVALFYRWYSSLFRAAKDRYSLNVVGLSDPSQPFVAPLKVGTHVITFAASDQSGETDAAQEQTRHGGVTGGSQGPSRRLVHALVANPVNPSPSPALPIPTLPRQSSTLEAEAPLQWGRKIGNTNNYEPNPDYHAINRIRYRWRFTPLGGPAGRDAADLVPSLDQLEFDPGPPADLRPVVRYQGPLPDALDTGNYTLTLRVEDVNNDAAGHDISRPVILT
jgi:hypothetical protein